MKESTDPLAEIFTAALRKFERGAAKYGTFDPATDARDFLQEAEAEVLDAINYLGMFLVKLRALQRKAETGQAAGQKKDPLEN